MAQEQALVEAGHHAGGVDDIEGIVPQMKATPGMPERQAVRRRQDRVRHILHTLPEPAQHAILESFEESNGSHAAPAYQDHSYRDDDTQVIPAYPGDGYDESARHHTS